MPQEYTNILNRTVTGVGFSDTESPPGSLSVRLENIPEWSYAKIYDIAWGIKAGVDANLTAFDFAELFVIQGERFQPNQIYRITDLSSKNIIWGDALSREHKFLCRQFRPAMRLPGGTDYLIVFSSPRAQGQGGLQFDCMLTVRGEFCSYKKKKGDDLWTPALSASLRVS